MSRIPIVLFYIIFIHLSLPVSAQNNVMYLSINNILGIDETSYSTSNGNNPSIISAPYKQQRLEFGSSLIYQKTFSKSNLFIRVKLNHYRQDQKYFYKSFINHAHRDSSDLILQNKERHYGIATDFGKQIQIGNFNLLCGILIGYERNVNPLDIRRIQDYRADTLYRYYSNQTKNTNNTFQSIYTGITLALYYKVSKHVLFGCEISQHLTCNFHKGQIIYENKTYDVKNTSSSIVKIKKDGYISNQLEVTPQMPLISFSIGIRL